MLIKLIAHSILAPMSIPSLAPASQLGTFKFYSNCQIHEAIMHDNVIMKLAKVLPSDQRDEAYHIAHALSQCYSTVLSPATDVYRVWVDVRCPDDSIYLCRCEGDF